MAERRKWDRSARELPVGGADAKAEDAADPVLQKQRQYIKILEERNRLKKRLAETQQRKRDKLQEREEAFITAFNVPTPAGSAAGGAAAAARRKSKSATSQLPSKMTAFDSEHAQCKSAPAIGLGYANGSTDRPSMHKPRTAGRAKWAKPQGPMTLAAEVDQEGKTQYCLAKHQAETDRDMQPGAKDESKDEESYLEESFEEFDDGESEGEANGGSRLRRSRVGSLGGQPSDIVIDETRDENDEVSEREEISDGEDESKAEEKSRQRASAAAHSLTSTPSSPHGLSDTTRDLMGMVQHLSRSKQHALMEVLHKFESSQKQDSDVRELRSSIGDPEIWRQLTTTVLAQGDSAPTGKDAKSSTKAETGSIATKVSAVDQVLEEHRRWEEQYANEMRQRLAKEREAKEAVLREAEARRMAMLKQLEDEERELDRLMELKRRERLAKLRALEQQDEETELSSDQKLSARVDVSGETKHDAAQKTATVDAKAASESKTDFAARELEAKPAAAFSPNKQKRITDHETLDSGNDEPKPKVTASSTPVVPPLKLAASVSPPILGGPLLGSDSSNGVYEMRVKLVSTWVGTRVVGLTQITVYDSDGAEIKVDLSSLRLYDHLDGKALPKSHDMVRGLQRLFNGIAHTNSEQEMWLGRLPDSGVLQIAFELSGAPAKLCIWNYNSKTCSACVRDVEVLLNRKCVWTGSLPESYGDANDNPCSWISVTGNTKKSARSSTRPDVQTRLLPATSSSTSSAATTQSAREEARRQEPATARELDRPKDDSPLWLSDARTSMAAAPRTARELGSSDLRQTTSVKSLNSDMYTTTASGSAASRRRPLAEAIEGEPPAATRSRDWRSEMKMVNDHESTSEAVSVLTQRKRDTTLSAKTVDEHTPHLAAVDALDSLERFSKTNRSSLSAAVEPNANDRSAGGKASLVDSAATSTRREMKRSGSTLLDEFRLSGTNRSLPTHTGDPVGSGSSSSITIGLGAVTQTRSAETVEKVPSCSTVEVPVLPSGRWLRLEILSTWGDPYYVGLNGIEVFDHRGELISFRDAEKQVTAFPESVNVLDENHDDPRVPKNLVDGNNFTCDDYHMWLAPFTPGGEHYVVLEMNSAVAISMVRVWNYNKSRAHTSRGVRDVRLILPDTRLDQGDGGGGSVIFEGEICQAPGIVSSGSFDNSNEVILFTREPAILAAIEANDDVLRAFVREQEDEVERETSAKSLEIDRPRTSDKDGRTARDDRISTNQGGLERDAACNAERREDCRPMTTASTQPRAGVVLRQSRDALSSDEPHQRSPVLSKVLEDAEASGCDSEAEAETDGRRLIRGQRLVIRLLTTWGDRNYIGLTQLDVLVGAMAVPLRLELTNLDASPRDLASLGYHGDPRTIDKLIDGVGTTCDDTHMWLVPLQQEVVLSIDLKSPQQLFGLRFWNYNKSADDSARGVKQLHVWLDGSRLSPSDTGFVLRKAPGTALFDFAQIVPFHCSEDEDAAYVARVRPPPSSRAYRTPVVRQDYEPPLFPQGFVLKLVIWCTWGDPYYVGLNGLELFDALGRKITDAPRVVAASPSSVADMPGGDPGDSRVPANLLSGCDKNTREAHDAWLAPLASSLRSLDGVNSSAGNVVFVVFDSPVTLSLVKFWNYAKTPERGVRELDMYLDDLHVFSGSLRRAPDGSARGYSKSMDDFSQPVLFTSQQSVVDAEKRRVLYCGGEEQDVLCINEGQVMRESRAMYRKPDPGAEGVVVDLSQRPVTAMGRQ